MADTQVVVVAAGFGATEETHQTLLALADSPVDSDVLHSYLAKILG